MSECRPRKRWTIERDRFLFSFLSWTIGPPFSIGTVASYLTQEVQVYLTQIEEEPAQQKKRKKKERKKEKEKTRQQRVNSDTT